MPTPLGNLRDITLRALDVLRECDVIAAEDTRVTRRLLSAHGISGKPLLRHDRHSPPAALDALIAQAMERHVALTTDAGMPGIADPGQSLVARARAAGVRVEVLPGPSAFVCAAVLSGFEAVPLLFDGFPPRAVNARRERIRRALRTGAVVAWYESPHRLPGTLDLLAEEAPDAQVFVGRELTKMFEQHLVGTPAEVRAALPTPLKGEITLVVRPNIDFAAEAEPEDAERSLDERIDELLAAGETTATIAKTLARAGLGERRAIYARALERREAET